MEFFDPISYAVPFFIILMIAEGVALKLRGIDGYDVKDTFFSLAMGIGSLVVKIVFGAAVSYAAHSWVYSHRLIENVPVNWWTILICFVLYDLAYYWQHRFGHEYRWFWASHVNHHSSQRYNLSTALRQTWTGTIALTFIFGLPIALFGFPPEMIFFVAAWNLLYQFWIHTELVDRMGPLEWIFNTPSHHRVHHATNPRYLDSNYAGTLIIWDRMFGTFSPEVAEDPPRYGIGKNLETNNLLIVAFHEWIAMVKDLKTARSLKDVYGYMFRTPGWTPDGSRMTTKKAKANWKRKQERLKAQEDGLQSGEGDPAAKAVEPAE
ncbi:MULTISPECIES: sterol desaturase family protein [unclassified Pseudovibrio]|uniref:sterol desaturase family protein n=1 Tax=unclassified Pseudovibrio TaxID=2627060 RepID=UPI000186C0B4|nr:sterol desaturase family protein [Pseudovibrio sp. JE062]EEA93596.1 C-5 sterol desaturase [Pseudovibrio sp. JE062]